MRRLTFRLVVAILTFTVGIAAASLWFIFHHSSPVVRHEENSPISPAPSPVQQKRKYERGTTAGETFTEDRYIGYFSNFYSSDGMKFSRWCTEYNSPRRANREMQKTLKKAREIIKREPLFDGSGQQIGEKVISTFSPNNPYYGAASLLSTDGSTFCYVTSSSLENIMAYEQDFNQ
ncbi:MAG: hypothetical protein QOH25_2249 [Acidobacteriota bacterium]|jgi:hypothetical protein|nr:hypothetical protein [Acidobacteriota bacterium]